ncbi:MAG TPA: carboxypeptidase-like regulatory domain-containing protein, partial [Bdellovibrionota bacterium]|nr:carboxypeptidase-like regulatory domain-containing protein [Bdellovibrionota bacterium]
PVKKEGYLKLNLDDDVEVTLNEKPVEWKKDFPLALTPGEYSLTLKKPGFAQINQHIVIAEGETAVINAKTQK